ncbi:MAG TPA: WecB/TagA/CpsF family glycosyltransferase [Mycobacteriales bacterium]|nr:WecB/TagA/CpsF family glycosyltransferase [Mycobacteriales bacterium]
MPASRSTKAGQGDRAGQDTAGVGIGGSPTTNHPVVWCAGVPITACGRADAARTVVDLARDPAGGIDIHLCNAYTLHLASRDRELMAVLRSARLNFPDGQSVVWANRLTHRGLGLPTERVYGPDLFGDVLDLGRPAGLRHFLLGSTPDVLTGLRARLGRDHPDATVVGGHSPPFRPLDRAERHAQADMLRDSGAQVVWVGLGTPKQDREVHRLAGEVPAVFVAVGAAFDFLAATKPQAPAWMRRNGLEWTYRLAHEPRRLWRRYLFGNVGFVRAAAHWAIRDRR